VVKITKKDVVFSFTCKAHCFLVGLCWLQLAELAQFFNLTSYNSKRMQNWLRALIAGYGAKKLGGGCFGTILVFIIIYWMLGHC